MNFDKKRRSRVQGGWAVPSKTKTHCDSTKDNETRDCTDISSRLPNHAKNQSRHSEKEKSEVQPMAIWAGKQIGQQRCVYEEPIEVRD